MPYNPDIHHRRTIRWKTHNYSDEGIYFITLIVSNRACLLGEIENQKVKLSNLGKEVKTILEATQTHYPNAILHEYIIMPNHLHAIIEINHNTHSHISSRPQFNTGRKDALPPLSTNPPAMAHPCAQSPTNPHVGAHLCAQLPTDPHVGAHLCAQSPTDPHVGAHPCAQLPPNPPVGAHLCAQLPELARIIRGFKAGVSSRAGFSVWQRNYYERVIRDYKEHRFIAYYIENNPSQWQQDKYRP